MVHAITSQHKRDTWAGIEWNSSTQSSASSSSSSSSDSQRTLLTCITASGRVLVFQIGSTSTFSVPGAAALTSGDKRDDVAELTRNNYGLSSMDEFLSYGCLLLYVLEPHQVEKVQKNPAIRVLQPGSTTC